MNDVVYQMNDPIRIRIYGWKNDSLPVRWESIVLTGEIYSKKSYHAVDWEMTIRSIDYLDRADSKSTWVIVAEFLRKRQQIALDVLSADHDRFDDHAGIQQAIMLGIREKVSMPMRNLFRDTGCMHVFAISGLHVGLLILVFTLLLKVIGISLNQMGWVLIPILILFAIYKRYETECLES